VNPMSPAQFRYRMPAEWEPHDALWLAWPHDPLTFPDRLPQVEEIYLRMIEALHSDETVHLLVRDEEMKARVSGQIRRRGLDGKRIRLHIFEYADVWIRDTGPIFLVREDRKGLAMVDWDFNAWGGKYATHLKDNRIPAVIHCGMKIPRFIPHKVLEGGAIDVNGKGTLLTTETCLMNANRNANPAKDDIEKTLRDYLGVRKIIWLKQGIAGDDTDGHVDTVARFVAPETIVCAYEEDKKDENHEPLRENYERLRRARDPLGRPFRIRKIPMPGAVRGPHGRLPASYANFYIGNRVVLVPVFHDRNDSIALEEIGRWFPNRKVIGIDCRDLIVGLGALHCVTQQQPAVVQE